MPRSGREARTRSVSLAIAVAVAGCASPRVDVGRPIAVQDHWYGHTYEQRGEPVGRCRVGFALYSMPETRAPAWSAATYATNGVLFLGGSIGAGLAASQTSRGTSAALIGVSGASLLVSAFLFHRADARLAEAVGRNNARLTRPVTPGASAPASPPACAGGSAGRSTILALP